MSKADQHWMAYALRLAENGLYTTAPNPRVGCVLLKDGKIIGEGWHQRAGEAHAEVLALRSCQVSTEGATAYVTLEPCNHHGRTPPCTEALLAAGIRRVVVAMQDPNPRVSGSGLAHLRAAGVDVCEGVLAEEAQALNPGFISRMTRQRPWVRLKMAASIDGKSALLNGRSQWITGAKARQDGHHWRALACAILSASGTVLADDPQLTVRGVKGGNETAERDNPRHVLKVIVDSQLQTPPNARLLDGSPVLIATTAAGFAQTAKAQRLQHMGAELLVLPTQAAHVDLHALMQALGQRSLNELHVEGGARFNAALLEADLVDELLLYIAPCVIGTAAQGLFALPEKSILPTNDWRFIDTHVLGDDLRIRAIRHPRSAHGMRSMTTESS